MIRVGITPFFGAKGCKKMNKIKRGLALLLTTILLCTALPISAQAKTTGNKTVNKANIVLFGYLQTTRRRRQTPILTNTPGNW